MPIQSEFVQINDRTIHVRVYSPEKKETIICWHGLARIGYDFHEIAEILSRDYRVLCPDTIGRGLSQWAEEPEKEYNYANYVVLADSLCQYFNLDKFDWIGTSMGGIIGILLASGSYQQKIKHLILNDIGPEVPQEALERIIEYTTGEQPRFDTYPEFETYYKEIYFMMGERTQEEWLQLTSRCLRRTEKGKFTVHFDPDILQLPKKSVAEVDLWQLFGDIECPVMVLHGEQSDVLTSEIIDRMQTAKPNLYKIDIPGCGHAPGLHRSEHFDPVIRFLKKDR